MLLVERFERYAKMVFCRSEVVSRDYLTNRALLKNDQSISKKLSEQGLITKEGNKILVDQSQYERLKEIISKIVALE